MKAWVFPKSQVFLFIKAITEVCNENEIKIKEAPKFVQDLSAEAYPFATNSKIAKSFTAEYAKDPKVQITDLPEKIYKSLYGFQKAGVEFGIKMHGRILLGDEMGVGKTIQAIAIAYMYKLDWPLLIMTPASLKFTWRDEILKFLP